MTMRTSDTTLRLAASDTTAPVPHRNWRRRRRSRPTTIAVLLLVAGFVAFFVAGCGGGDETSTVTSPAGSETSVPLAPTVTEVTPTRPSPTVEVYFGGGDGTDCGEVVAFPRTIEPGHDLVRATFDALVAGPTDAEIATGANSVFDGSTAASVAWAGVADDLLTVDFDDIRRLIPDASSSCGSESFLAQLSATAFQFPQVERARFQIGGSCELFAEFLQRSCFQLHRDGTSSELPLVERAGRSGCTPGTGDGLPDGRWYGAAVALEPGVVSFDLACWFVGEAAAEAAAADGQESPPPNDYHVRDDNPLVRALPVAPETQVTWYPDGSPDGADTAAYDGYAALVADRGFHLALWVTVADGQVVAIDEQWIP